MQRDVNNAKRLWPAALWLMVAACASGATRGVASSGGSGGSAGSGAGGSAGARAAGSTSGTGPGAGGSGGEGVAGSIAGGAGTAIAGAAGSAAIDGGATNRDGAAQSDASTGGSSPGGGNGTPIVTQFDTNCLGVPDPDIAASDTLVGMVGQWTAYFYKKDGTPDHKYTWKAAEGSLISDTHIVFDAQSQRWYLTTILDTGGGSTAVQVMVSTDATASSWQTSVPAKYANLIDNPQPTVTSDKVLLTFHGSTAWVVDKSALANGNAAVVQPTATDLPSGDNWVAVKYGGSPPSTAYAVTMIDQTTLAWLSVDGTQAKGDVSLKVNMIKVPRVDSYPFGQSLYAASAGGNTYENGEVKAMAQNGHLYWGKTVTCGSMLCERLFDIDTNSNTAKTTDFTFPGNSMWFGVPGVDKYRNVWMLATASTTAGPLGLALMGVYSSGTVYSPAKILMGIDQVGKGQVRMGDYASAAQDPTDGSVWLIGMYGAKNPNPLNQENNLGCRAVHVTVP